MAIAQPVQSPSPTDWRRLAVTVGLLAAALVALLTAFALPPLHSGPNDIPLAVVGPAPVVEQIGDRLDARYPGGFELRTVADAERARDLIRDREVYGAIVVAAGGPSFLIASAASPAVATLLKNLAAAMAAQDGRQASAVEDVVPLPPDDRAGAGLSVGALPLALGGWIGAVVLLMTVRGASRKAVGAMAFAVVGACSLTAVLQFWFGSITGDYWRTCAGAALGIGATAWMILGLRTALGNPGLGLGAVTLILLGNPLSGLNSAPELLPQGWGTFGQLLPPGATGSLIRSLAFFDGAAATRPVIVLTCWLLGGIALFVVGERRAARARAAEVTPAPAAEPAAVSS